MAAFDNLQPVKPQILAWREENLTLAQITDRLAREHSISTSPGSLSRFLREVSPKTAPRAANGMARDTIDTLTVMTELLAEIRGRGDEQRMAAEYLAGQVRILTEVIEESGRGGAAPAPQAASPSKGGFWLGLAVGVAITATGALLITQLL